MQRKKKGSVRPVIKATELAEKELEDSIFLWRAYEGSRPNLIIKPLRIVQWMIWKGITIRIRFYKQTQICIVAVVLLVLYDLLRYQLVQRNQNG